MNINRKRFLEITLTGGLGVLFGGAAIPKSLTHKGAALTPVSRQTVAMGSVISFQVIADSEEAGYEAIRKGENVFRNMERIFSMYDDNSEMAMLGKNAGMALIELSSHAIEVLTFARNVSTRSGGRFDVTIEPAMKQWGFRKNPGEEIQRPTESELKKLKRIIGSDKISIEENKALLEQSGMAIDMGGIAGGYTLDKAIEKMKKSDISAAFINFSGDIHCFGKPLEGEGWPVHILDPYTREPLEESVVLNNEALSTSGAYQNRRKNNADESWGHLLLPNSAKPVEPVGSVTAIASSAMQADAWSTAAYVGADAPAEIKMKVIQ